MYYIRNVGTNKYADVKGPSTSSGALIHQWDFHTSNQEKWIIEYVPNSGGYIRFKSAYSNLFLGIDPSNTTVVKQYEANNYTSWKIDRTSSGNYILTNKATENSNNVLSVPLGTPTNGTNLTQLTYTNNLDYNDEWRILSTISSVQLEAQQQELWCWVAAARMSSMKHMQSYVSQASAAVFIKQGIRTLTPTEEQIQASNDTGTLNETQHVIEYILGMENDDYYYCISQIYDEVTLKSALDLGYPVIITRGWYRNDGVRDGGHATVIYNYYYDSTKNVYLYEIFDSDSIVGTYSKSYTNICNGRIEGFQGEKTDRGKWEGIVVYKIGDYMNTIPNNQ